jgi:hypothetical protein
MMCGTPWAIVTLRRSSSRWLAPGAHSPAGQRLPAAVLLIPLWMGRGLPAPIALGLPRGHLPARLPFGPDRSLPPAGHSAMRPSAKRTPKACRRRPPPAAACASSTSRATSLPAPDGGPSAQRPLPLPANASVLPEALLALASGDEQKRYDALGACLQCHRRSNPYLRTRPSEDDPSRDRSGHARTSTPLQALRQVSRRPAARSRYSPRAGKHTRSPTRLFVAELHS